MRATTVIRILLTITLLVCMWNDHVWALYTMVTLLAISNELVTHVAITAGRAASTVSRMMRTFSLTFARNNSEHEQRLRTILQDESPEATAGNITTGRKAGS
jgi:hypothetical protein